MKLLSSCLERLRATSRGNKLLFILSAAWAPILLFRHPLLAGIVVLSGTALFFYSIPPVEITPLESADASSAGNSP